jgi:hypothetical protein
MLMSGTPNQLQLDLRRKKDDNNRERVEDVEQTSDSHSSYSSCKLYIWLRPFTALFTASALLHLVSADPCADELASFG